MSPKSSPRCESVTRKSLTTILIGLAVVVGTAGIAFPAAAHPQSDHCWQKTSDWLTNPISDCSTQSPSPSISGDYNAPPIEGPGDPDGGGDTFPYIFQAVIFTQCTPDNVGGEEFPVDECVRNGGATWNACDSFQHWNLGGNPDGDVPCSWERDTFTGDQTDATVGGDLPFDTLAISFDCLTCAVPRNIPYVVTTNSRDDDSFFGEGVGADGANDGDCPESTTGDVFELLLACNDGGPGPRELEVGACGDANQITRPSSTEWGTGDGIWQQGLSDESYLTHHLDNDEVREHPGSDGFAIFLLGPIHGRQACPTASAFTTVAGTFTVTAS